MDVDMKKNAVFRASLGFSIGVLISALIMSSFASTDELFSRMMLLSQLVGSGLYGAICMGATIVYDIEEWSLLRATLTHYVITFASFFITNKLLGWFDSDILLFAFVLLSIGYVGIWIVEYTAWKISVSQMNSTLDMIYRR